MEAQSFQKSAINTDAVKLAALDTAVKYSKDSEQLVIHKQMEYQLGFDIDKLKLKVQAAVANAVDAAGKPLFSNEIKRNAEVQDRLDKDSAYKELQAQLGHEQDEIAQISASLDRLKTNLKAYDIATRD